MKSEIENLVENIRGNKNFKNAECKNYFKVEKVGRKHSANWNQTDSIPNFNQKYSDPIHIDTNHTNSNQTIPSDSKNIGSIHDSSDICAIEKILALLVHSTVPAPQIFLYGLQVTPRHHHMAHHKKAWQLK